MSLTSVFVLFAAVEWMVHKLSWQVLVRSKPEVADGREPRWRPSFLIGRLHSCIRTKLWRTLSQQNESLNTKMLYWTWSKIKFHRLLLFYYIMQKIPTVWSNCSHFITALLWLPEFCIMNWPGSNLIKTSSSITIYWEISTMLFICTSKIKNNIYMSDLF